MTDSNFKANQLTASFIVEQIYGSATASESDILGLLAEDVLVSEWTHSGVVTKGIAQFNEVFIEPAEGAFTECSHQILNAITAADHVTICGIFQARFIGKFLGIEPHGNMVSWEIRDVFDLCDGKITRAMYAQDTLQLAKQLGAISASQAPW